MNNQLLINFNKIIIFGMIGLTFSLGFTFFEKEKYISTVVLKISHSDGLSNNKLYTSYFVGIIQEIKNVKFFIDKLSESCSKTKTINENNKFLKYNFKLEPYEINTLKIDVILENSNDGINCINNIYNLIEIDLNINKENLRELTVQRLNNINDLYENDDNLSKIEKNERLFNEKIKFNDIQKYKLEKTEIETIKKDKNYFVKLLFGFLCGLAIYLILIAIKLLKVKLK